MVDDKGGCPWVDIACIPIIPQHQLLIHVNVAQDLHLLSLASPQKLCSESMHHTHASPFWKRWGSSTHFPTVSPCFHSLNIMPVPPPTYNPPGAWCVCNVKRTTPKAPTSLLKAGFRGKGSPEKGEDTTPTYGWDDNVCWVFVWGVSVWNQKCGETCNLHVITRITK